MHKKSTYIKAGFAVVTRSVEMCGDKKKPSR